METPSEKSPLNDQDSKTVKEAISTLYHLFEKNCVTSELSEVDIIRKLAHFVYDFLCVHFKASNYFSQQESQHLENLAVSLYLEEWLECDENARQTIYSFSSQEYVPRSEQTYKNRSCAPDDRRKRLERAASVFCSMQKLQQNHAQRNNSASPPLAELSNTGRKYNFIDLRHFDLYAERRLDLYRLLVLRKELMTCTADKGSYKTLAAAYEEYDSLFEDAKGLSSDKEYVIACMHIRKYESAFRFHLAAKLAKYMMENELQASAAINDATKAIWGRYRSYALCLPEQAPDQDPINEPYDILYYDRKIQSAFQSEDISARAILWRNMFVDVLYFMNLLKPPKEQRSWADADFSAAADFFRKDHPVIESYVPVAEGTDNITTSSKSYYAHIQSIYKELSKMNGVTLTEFRNSMRTTQKNGKTTNSKNS